MNPFKALWGGLKKSWPFINLILNYGVTRGFNEALVKQALAWVRVAARKEIDKAERREWVVQILMEKGVKESIARLVVELAYQAYKSEFEQV